MRRQSTRGERFGAIVKAILSLEVVATTYLSIALEVLYTGRCEHNPGKYFLNENQLSLCKIQLGGKKLRTAPCIRLTFSAHNSGLAAHGYAVDR